MIPAGFLAPGRLWLLLAVAGLAAGYVLAQRRRSAYAVRFTDLALLDRVAPRRPGWRRHAPAAAYLAMLVLLVTAFAQPTGDTPVPRERATVVVVVDTSVSMEATDVAPSRMEAARAAAQRFTESLPPRFNVGLVAFSGTASLLVAPTTDREQVRAGLANLDLGPRTAIGEGVFTALTSVRALDARAAEEPPPARIVLLSDGANTAGREPSEAAAAARDAGVPVSTIAYGTPDGTVVVDGQQVRVPVDGPALAELARVSGGTAYAAASGEELEEVYEDIGTSVGYRIEQREVSARYVGLALLAALAAALASLRWFARLP